MEIWQSVVLMNHLRNALFEDPVRAPCLGFQNRHSKEAPQNRCKSLESQINLAQAGRFPFKEISTGTIQGQVEHTIRGSSLCKGVGALAIGTRRHLPFVPDHKTIDLTRSYPVGSASEQIPRGRGAAGSPLRLVPGARAEKHTIGARAFPPYIFS